MLVDLAAYIAVRTFVIFLNLLPMGLRLTFCRGLVRIFLALFPKYRRIALRNISLVFPNMDQKKREELFQRSITATARFIVDGARLHTLDRAWMEKHVRMEYPPSDEFLAENRKRGRGLLIVTGHLGSFELMARASAMLGYPLSFVVRNFNLKRLDRWWTMRREEPGNRVISRDGAFIEVMKDLDRGNYSAILFDQNVKRNHAVFVPFFGRPAATTKSVALAALKTKVPVLVVSMSYEGEDNYILHVKTCDFTSIYEDSETSYEENVKLLTEGVTKVFEEMILAHPDEWFWMHRRWKTTPEGVPEDFYA